MSAQRSYPVTPLIKREDPAGADKVVLAAAKAGTQWVEGLLHRAFGLEVDLWNGPNGAGAVVQEAVINAGIPNKRFHEFVTPRAVAEKLELVRPKKRLKKK